MTMKPASNLPPPPKYEVYDHDDIKDLSCIRIKDGLFEDLEFHFDVIKLEDIDDEGNIPLRYTYTVVKPIERKENDIRKEGTNEEFHEVATSILLDIVGNS